MATKSAKKKAKKIAKRPVKKVKKQPVAPEPLIFQDSEDFYPDDEDDFEFFEFGGES